VIAKSLIYKGLNNFKTWHSLCFIYYNKHDKTTTVINLKGQFKMTTKYTKLSNGDIEVNGNIAAPYLSLLISTYMGGRIIHGYTKLDKMTGQYYNGQTIAYPATLNEAKKYITENLTE
jgi:hypothetical protein